MRSIWKGAITFGLIYVPVKVYAATEKKDIKFNFLHEFCHSPLQYNRYCPQCEKKVKNEEIVRGYEYEKGQFVIMTQADFDLLPGEKNRSVDILDFVDIQQIDPVYFDKSYYLAPGEGGQKVYELLRRAMEETKRAAIAKVTLRNRESMAVVRSCSKALIMETMFYADEVRSVQKIDEIGGQVNLHDNEIKMAINLIKSLSSDFNPAKYSSAYREKLREVIQAKINGQEVSSKPVASSRENVVDLMTALQASIELAQEHRGKKIPGDRAKRKRQEKTGEI